MMGQLSLYAPAIMGLIFAAVAFLSVRHIAANRLQPERRATPQSEEEPPLPFDELKSVEELREQIRANHHERIAEHHP